MALVRCREHPPKGRDGPYVESVKPIGYPDTAAVCGRPECENPGLLWLKKNDAKAWREGQTVFGVHTHTVKIKVERHQPRTGW